jgi:DNA-binding transcriptional ArsR family regulator
VPLPDGGSEQAIQVAPADIAATNRLFTHVYGLPLADLPAHTVHVLYQIHEMLRARQRAADPQRFTRRELRDHTGLSMTALARHLDRLVGEELVLASGQTGRGVRVSYTCDFDPAQVIDDRFCGGLIGIDALACSCDDKLTPPEAQLLPSSHAQNTPKTQGSHPAQSVVSTGENGQNGHFPSEDAQGAQGGALSQFAASKVQA